MRKSGKRSQRLAQMALLLAAALVLSWIELLLSLPMPVPGMKIGLANLAILFTLYCLGKPAALMVLTGRLLLSALLFGNASSLIFSAAGGYLSFAVMCLAQWLLGRHVVVVSILGGIFHNIGQLAAASVVLSTPLWWYLPYLLIGGMAAGALNGWLTSLILKSRFFSALNSSRPSSEPAPTDKNNQQMKQGQ